MLDDWMKKRKWISGKMVPTKSKIKFVVIQINLYMIQSFGSAAWFEDDSYISVKGHSWSINVIESLVPFWCYYLFDQSQWQQEIHSDVGEQLNILKNHGQNLAIIVLPNILAFWCWQVTSQPYKKIDCMLWAISTKIII